MISKYHNLYLQVRAKEGRVHSDELVARLPHVPRTHPLWAEWQARAASAARLIKYLSRLPKPLTILDLGCGNGWLANQMAQVVGCRVLGLDRNQFELAQAARVFTSAPRLEFIDADIFSAPLPEKSINVIIIASAIQYFPDVAALIRRLKLLLKPPGEIHILDSPLYASAEVAAARARTEAYYAALGFPEMAAHYHHHCLDALAEFQPTQLYNPKGWQTQTLRVLGNIPDSPFSWFRL